MQAFSLRLLPMFLVAIAGVAFFSCTQGQNPSGGLPSGGLPSGGLPSGGLPSGGLPSGGLPSGGLQRPESPNNDQTSQGGGGDESGAADTGGADGGGVVTRDGGTTPGVSSGCRARDGAETSVYFVGHSLIGHELPMTIDLIAQRFGKNHSYTTQILNGAPMYWNWRGRRAELRDTSGSGWRNGLSDLEIWDNGFPPAISPENRMGNARDDLLSGRYDVLVVTEGSGGDIPLDVVFYGDPSDPNSLGMEADTYLARYYDLAVDHNPNACVYFYEHWPQTSLPDFRGLVNQYRAVWLRAIDFVNQQHKRPDQPAVRMIPGGQAMGRLYDAIQASQVPGHTSIDDFFDDGIHINEIGRYLIAMVHYATIYGTSPVGAVNQTHLLDWSTTAIPQDLAGVLQQIAWETVLSEPYSGVME